MAISLHAQAKLAMTQALEAGLPHVKVKNGKWLESVTAFLAAWKADQALPSNGKLREQLVGYIDELPFVDFVIESLRRELDEDPDHDEATPNISLTQLKRYEDYKLVAACLVEKFETLPWQYSFAIQLPGDLIPVEIFEGKPLPVGVNGYITQPDMVFRQQFSLHHPNPRVERRAKGPGLLAIYSGDRPEWKDDGSYFIAQDSGFIGIYGGGNMFDRVERRLESFLGFGLATKLFSYSHQHANVKPSLAWFVHRNLEGAWAFDSRFEANTEIENVVRHMTSFRFSDSYPQDNRLPWLRSMINKAYLVLSSDRIETLQLATKWFFDSFKGDDQTLKYIRLMTTIEILVGEHTDTSKMSLGELLGNRLAYLIGTNHQDRADTLQEFKKIYGVRSSILHHGKHKLTGPEKGYIARLRSYCERAIEAEARLMIA